MLHDSYYKSYNMIISDNCKTNKKILTCKIFKEKLKEIFIRQYHDDDNYLGVFTITNIGLINLYYIKTITINYQISNKIDIYVGINKVFLNEKEERIIAFQTNITSFQNLKTKNFGEYNCYFKNININPLLLVCIFDYRYDYSFNATLDKELILDDIHSFYNFRIQPFNLNITISIPSPIDYEEFDYYPKEFSFETKNSNILVIFPFEGIMDINDESKISLIYSDSNQNSNYSYFYCDYIRSTHTLICNISIFYFIKLNQTKTGYYYISYSIYKRKSMIDYSLSPLKIIFPKNIITINVKKENNSKEQIISKNGIFFLITDYNDTKTNIFDISDIEEKTLFKTTLTENSTKNSNIYDITCRFFKQNNRNLMIICSLNNFDAKNELIINAYFNQTAFSYNNYRIIILSDEILSLQILNTSSPILYSNEQTISIKEAVSPIPNPNPQSPIPNPHDKEFIKVILILFKLN